MSFAKKCRVSETWVLNAFPIILFARVDGLDLIHRLAAKLTVPQAVITEVRAGEPDDPFARAALSFGESYRTDDLPVPDGVAHWDLGSGETQVIVHALHAPAWAVLDDLAARRCAATHQIPVIGSIGIVLRAKSKGLVDAAAPWIEKLKAAG